MRPIVGRVLRQVNGFRADSHAPTGVEIEFSRAGDPLRGAPFLAGLAFDYVSVHSLMLSVSSPEPPADASLDALVAVARENGAAAVSDHLTFTRTGEIGAARATLHFTPAALDTVCRNIDAIQRRLGDLDFFLENLAHVFRPRGTMSEAEFLRRMLARTGCGWLLDVTNVYHNALNFGDDPCEFLRAVMPAARRVQMHLSGGYRDERSGKYLDSRSELIADPVWVLYREALELGGDRVEAVFLDRDGDGWLDEVRKARWLADEVEEVTQDTSVARLVVGVG